VFNLFINGLMQCNYIMINNILDKIICQ